MDIHLDRLVEQVENRKQELIDLVSTLIKFKTPAPPARNTREIQQFIANYLKELHFGIDMWDVYPNDPNLVGVKKGVQSDLYNSLILNGHVDVAEIREDENWLTHPFDPVVTDGKIIGRGAADMKGGLAGALFAIQLLSEAGVDQRVIDPLQRGIRIRVGGVQGAPTRDEAVNYGALGACCRNRGDSAQQERMVGDDEVCAPLQGFVNNSGDRVHGEENFLHFLPGIPHHETHRIPGLRGARRIAPLEAPNYILQG